jgi:hypothetical protein
MGNRIATPASWRLAGASVRGSSHEKASLPCQDAHKWAQAAGDILVIAVADGAGSAPMSETGAWIAVETAVETACKAIGGVTDPGNLPDAEWDGLLRRAVEMAKESLTAEADRRSVPANSMATTLVLVVAGTQFVASVQIGDGSVIGVTTEGAMISLLKPSWTEYLNETVFLTSAEGLPSARPTIWRGQLGDLAVLSDGLQMTALRMPSGDPHPGFFTPLFQFLKQQPNPATAREELIAFLSSPRLRERTDDDVTLVLATRVT